MKGEINVDVLFIDTCILRGGTSFFESTSATLVEQVCAHELIKLIIPNFIFEEFTRGVRENIQEQYNPSISEIIKIEKKLPEGIIKQSLQTVLTILEKSKSDHLDYSLNMLDTFIKKTNAEKIDIQKNDYDDAFTNYFNHKGIFSSNHNRKDIPDAIIAAQIINYSSKFDKSNIHVVTADGRFFEYLTKEGFSLYNSLKCFTESVVFTEYLRKMDDITRKGKEEQLQKKIDSIMTGLTDFSKEINQKIVSILERDLPYSEVIDSRINSDNHTANIDAINGFDDIVYNIKSYKKVTDSLYIVEFSATCDAEIEYFVYKHDYYDEQRNNSYIIDENWNDHYFEVGDSVLLNINGQISFSFDLEDLDVDNFNDVYNDYTITIDDLVIELQEDENNRLSCFDN